MHTDPGGPGPARRANQRLMRVEAGGWGAMRVIHEAFIQPLLIASGIGQLLLGAYISASSLFTYGAGWLGPSIASQAGSLSRATLRSLAIGRTSLALFVVYLFLTDDRQPIVLIALILIWAMGEGIAYPLWTSFLSGLVGASERGRWMALRGASATLVTIPAMLAITIALILTTRERALPVAYAAAAIAALVSLVTLRRMFRANAAFPLPPGKSIPSLPSSREARRHLLGVATFWFGAALTWPILTKYIIEDLNAPTAYFAVVQLLGGGIGFVVQARWGRMGDREGARRILLVSGIGSAAIPALWALTPVYWLGFAIDAIAFTMWPGHILGLTLRGVELAESEHERPALLGWTNLAQGGGACLSPLIASAVVGYTGVLAVLLVSAALRLVGTLLIAPDLRLPAWRPR